MQERKSSRPRRAGSRNVLLLFLRELERRLKGVILRTLELTPADRANTVHEMLTQRRREAIEYWTLLTLSMGIATLGLALNSTAVVIGAMLVSPLMTPIVQLAMGLVAGSPVLTFRSLSRIVGSVIGAVGGAALMTLTLPFHEVTAEIAARTEPTVLDLVLAVFVAIAAALASIRSKSEVSATAAGAAIGIALMPPLCVIGYGIGVGNGEIAGGASLLFVTNLTSIVLVGVLFFWLVGFERVATEEWDVEAIELTRPGSFTRRLLTFVETEFVSTRGRVLRVLLPVGLLAIVAAPLSRGLDRVAWEIRARGAVFRIIDDIPDAREMVQSLVSVKGGRVAVRLHLVGEPEHALSIERTVSEQIAAATGVVPDILVRAVPDLRAMREALGSLKSDSEPVFAGDLLPRLRTDIDAALKATWPAAFGAIQGWRLEVRDSARALVRIRHWGNPAGAGADALLSSALSARVPISLDVLTETLQADSAATQGRDAIAWLPFLTRAADQVAASRGLNLCFVIPDRPTLSRSASARSVAAIARAEAARLGDRAHISQAGDIWSVRVSAAPCDSSAAQDVAAADAL